MTQPVREIVQYGNDMNTISFRHFTAIDFNLFMTLCAKLKNKGTTEITLDFSDIKRATGYSTKNTNERFIEDLKRMNEKLLHVTFGYENDRLVQMFVLFTDYTIDKEEHTLTVSVNEKYTYLLNRLTSQFTKFELQAFNELSSKYTKTLYRLLMQFRKTGFLRMKIEDVIHLLCIPEGYSPHKIVKRILEPAVEELQEELPGLQMKVIRGNSIGIPIEGFQFRFDKRPKSQLEKILEPQKEEDAQQSLFNRQIRNLGL